MTMDNRWSARVTLESHALDLEAGVFTWKDPIAIARSLKRSAEKSQNRKTTEFRSAMSMLNFYINRAGKNLSAERLQILNQSKKELRNLFHRTKQFCPDLASPVNMKTRRIRYAVIGQGYISQIAVLPAFKHAKNSELVALVSGDEKKLKTLGRKYKVDKLYHYDNFDECLTSGDIDAIYIALPNDQHREYTERAARAKVHVLCEKPMAVTPQDCEAMIQVAKENRIKLMVAYRLHFEEANLRAIEAVQSGKIGEPKVFHSAFTTTVKDRGIRLLPRAQGGGPVYDIGIYCINAARNLFQDEPIEVSAVTINTKRKPFENIEETASVIMRFRKERVASFTCSFDCANADHYQILGKKGDLIVDNAYNFIHPKTHYLTLRDKTKAKEFRARDQFAAELIYFSDCILKNRKPAPSGEEGLADIRVIDAIFRSADSARPVSLELVSKEERPTISQEIKQPPVEKPELIETEEPHGEEAA